MPQTRHAMLVDTTHDELSSQYFVAALKSHISSQVTGGTRIVYDRRIAPRLAPKDRHAARKALSGDGHYQMASALKRTAQEMMWDSVGVCVERQLPALIDRAKPKTRERGTLRLDPSLVIPRYHTAVDIHCMPGGYHSEIAGDDVFAGALYDRGIYLFSMGLRGELNDDFGQSLVAWVKQTYPDFRPKRILDMGCSVGHMTTGLASFFPEAEIHAIDIGAALLRYARARASALGHAVHFAQQNAEGTDYPDGHFDLIVSSNLFHETSRTAAPRILAECHRLLRQGGAFAHMEVPVRYADMALYNQVMRGWQTYYNGEPFWDAVCSTDMVALAKKAGFAAASSGYVQRSADPVKEPRRFAEAPSEGNDYRWILTGTR